jgi:AcrR family transcriptional regulator
MESDYSPAANDSSSARLALILAAERLFAENGIQGVSLRQINEAAGQRNASATHYHFGSRDGLASAVFEYRMGFINSRRLARMETLAREARLHDLRALVSVLVWPLAEELRPRPEGNFYLRFLERAHRRRPGLVTSLTDETWVAGWRQATEALTLLLAYLPGPIVALRLGMAAQQCVSGLAAIEALGSEAVADLSLRVEIVIDLVQAGLVAPVSFETLQALRAGEERQRADQPQDRSA